MIEPYNIAMRLEADWYEESGIDRDYYCTYNHDGVEKDTLVKRIAIALKDAHRQGHKDGWRDHKAASK